MLRIHLPILIFLIFIQGCSFRVDLAFYNNTQKEIEVCNLNLKKPACQTIPAKSLAKVFLRGDIRLDAWNLTINNGNTAPLYKLRFGPYPKHASEIYCQGLFNHRCDIPVQYEENEALYWGGKYQKLPVKEFPKQPKGFPITPKQSMSKNNPEKLMEEASRLLDEFEPKKALDIGKQLEKMQFSGGFEIQALAYADLDKKRKAIAVLEKGIKTVPDLWILWQLLGNYYSDEGEIEKALAAFEKGLQTKNPDKVSLKYNFAIALQRQEEFKEAQALISEILSDERYPNDIEESLYLHIQGLRLSLLNNLKQHNETLELFEELKSIIAEHEDSQPAELSLILDEVATAHWKLGNKDQAEDYLIEAISYDKTNSGTQWLHREMHKEEDYTQAKYFRLIIEGIWHSPFEGETELPGFFTNYDVVANTEEEALEIIKFFEPPETHDSLKIAESEILKSPKQPKGVYRIMSYNFFPID